MRLSLRLGLILSTALALVVAVLIVTFLFAQRNLNTYGVILPLPAQTAAIVELVEATPPDKLPLVLQALTTPELSVAFADAPPSTQGTLAMPGMSVALKAYLAAMGGRPVSVMVELESKADTASIVLNRIQATASHPVRFVIGLHNGKYLVIEAHSALTERFTGIRLALLALFATAVIGAISLWMLNRQLRPLARLSHAVENFGTRLQTSAIPEEGTAELRELIKAFNRLQANIGELVAARTRMIAAIGHDVGTYLTRLRLRAEYIADEEQRAKAERDINDMRRMIDDTLALAKLDHESNTAEPVDIAPLLRNQVEAYAENGAAISLTVPDTPVFVRIAPSALHRAAGNLIANALKYGSEAQIGLFATGDSAEIRVEDRGPGIPEAERKAVLEPFYRCDVARNLDQAGFGLGLAIVSDIARLHGGTISLEDRPGGGLRVRLTIPLAG